MNAPLIIDPQAVVRFQRRVTSLPEPIWLHEEIGRRMGDKSEAILTQPTVVVDWWSTQGASQSIWQTRYPQAQRRLVEPDPIWQALHPRRETSSGSWWSRWRERWQTDKTPSSALFTEADPTLFSSPADLLWANMVIHWYYGREPALFEQWHRLLQPQGFLMFSGFGPDTAQALRDIYAQAGWGAPTLPLTDMHDLGDMLVSAGFAEPVMDMEYLTLTWADAPSMLKELQTLGLNTVPDRFAGCRTPRWKERLLDALTAHCSDGAGGRLSMRFEIIYGHAFRGAPKARDGETRVTIGDLRATLPSQRQRD